MMLLISTWLSIPDPFCLKTPEYTAPCRSLKPWWAVIPVPFPPYSVQLPAAWAWDAFWVTARPAWPSAAPRLLPGGLVPWAGACTTRAASLGLVSVQWQCGRGCRSTHLTCISHPPVLTEQARCRGEQISGTVGWWGPAPVFVTSLEACVTQSFLPGLHLLTFQQPPNASQPDKVGSQGWGPLWSIEGPGLRVFVFQMIFITLCLPHKSLHSGV